MSENDRDYANEMWSLMRAVSESETLPADQRDRAFKEAAALSLAVLPKSADALEILSGAADLFLQERSAEAEPALATIAHLRAFIKPWVGGINQAGLSYLALAQQFLRPDLNATPPPSQARIRTDLPRLVLPRMKDHSDA